MLCTCDNLSVCVKFAYVDEMLYLCMQYFMLYQFYVYGIYSLSDADLCVQNFFCVCNKLHCEMGKWRHLPNCNDSCDWSTHLWLHAGNPHSSSSMYLMILTSSLRGPIKTWYCSLVMVFCWPVDHWVVLASYSDIQSERPLQSMMVTSLPPTEPAHNAIYCMHINFLHTWIQWSHASEVDC
jgi:hypothetical protein